MYVTFSVYPWPVPPHPRTQLSAFYFSMSITARDRQARSDVLALTVASGETPKLSTASSVDNLCEVDDSNIGPLFRFVLRWGLHFQTVCWGQVSIFLLRPISVCPFDCPSFCLVKLLGRSTCSIIRPRQQLVAAKTWTKRPHLILIRPKYFYLLTIVIDLGPFDEPESYFF